MRKLHIVTGNHRSLHGISDIISIINSASETGTTQGIFFREDCHNFLVEEFSNREYTDFLLGDDKRFSLVLTEFIHKGPFGRIYLNRFGIKATSTYIYLETLAYYVLLILGKTLPAIALRRFHSFMYWRARERNLQRVLKSDLLKMVLTMHPHITAQALESKLIKPHVSIHTIYPILDQNKIDFSISKRTISEVTTFGTQNKYRLTERRKFQRFFPMQVSYKVDNNYAILQSKELFNPNTHSLSLDLYFKNSKNWEFLSPVRIWRTLNKGNIIVYFGKKMKDHPINDCAIQIEGYEDIWKTMSRNFEKEIHSSVSEYNSIALSENLKWKSELASLKHETKIKRIVT
jgi:hypothetical protein